MVPVNTEGTPVSRVFPGGHIVSPILEHSELVAAVEREMLSQLSSRLQLERPGVNETGS